MSLHFLFLNKWTREALGFRLNVKGSSWERGVGTKTDSLVGFNGKSTERAHLAVLCWNQFLAPPCTQVFDMWTLQFPPTTQAEPISPPLDPVGLFGQWDLIWFVANRGVTAYKHRFPTHHTTGDNKNWNAWLMARKGFLFRMTSARRWDWALKFVLFPLISLREGRWGVLKVCEECSCLQGGGESDALLVGAFPPACRWPWNTACREEEMIKNAGGCPWPFVSMVDSGFWSRGAREWAGKECFGFSPTYTGFTVGELISGLASEVWRAPVWLGFLTLVLLPQCENCQRWGAWRMRGTWNRASPVTLACSESADRQPCTLTEELLATIYLTTSDTGGRNASLIHKDSINLPQQNLKKPNSIENCIWLNF